MISETFIKHLELVAGPLPKDDSEALFRLPGDLCHLRKGEPLLREGEHPSQVAVVLSGLLQRYRTISQGHRQIHALYLPGDAPCLESLVVDVTDNTLAAATPSCVGLVRHADLHRLMDARPSLMRLFWRETLVQAAILQEWLMRNTQSQAPAKMAHFFCEMMTRARAAGLARGDTCSVPITQHDLAALLGMTPVHLSRTLMALRTERLVSFHRGMLSVLDWDRLVDVAAFNPAYLSLCGAASGIGNSDSAPHRDRLSARLRMATGG